VLAQRRGAHDVPVTDLGPGCPEAAHARASGKVLLGFGDRGRRDAYLAGRSLQQFTQRTITDLVRLQQELRAVRARGYATELEEVSPGVVCIGVPVFTNSVLLGAYTISTSPERFQRHADRYVCALREAAAQPKQLPLPRDDERRVLTHGLEQQEIARGSR
jgi:IclR family acetate operon transcriptional repressor